MSILAAKAPHKYPHPAFEGLSDKALNSLYSAGHVRSYAAGSCLFNTGDRERPAFLLLSGNCELLAPVQGEALLIKLSLSPAQTTGRLVQPLQRERGESMEPPLSRVPATPSGSRGLLADPLHHSLRSHE